MAKGKGIGKVAIAENSSMNEWQAQDDMRTLVEAEKIKKDPKRFAAARACAKKQYDAMEASGITNKKTSKEPDADD
jgi:ribosomal protein L19E